MHLANVNGIGRNYTVFHYYEEYKLQYATYPVPKKKIRWLHYKKLKIATNQSYLIPYSHNFIHNLKEIHSTILEPLWYQEKPQRWFPDSQEYSTHSPLEVVTNSPRHPTYIQLNYSLNFSFSDYFPISVSVTSALVLWVSFNNRLLFCQCIVIMSFNSTIPG